MADDRADAPGGALAVCRVDVVGDALADRADTVGGALADRADVVRGALSERADDEAARVGVGLLCTFIF